MIILSISGTEMRIVPTDDDVAELQKMGCCSSVFRELVE